MRVTQIESGYFTSEYISTSELEPGQELLVGWRSDRLIRIVYLGGFRFKVTSSENAQLQVGDEFEATNFSIGFPLYIPIVIRGEEKLASYVAGSFNGLTTLKVLPTSQKA